MTTRRLTRATGVAAAMGVCALLASLAVAGTGRGQAAESSRAAPRGAEASDASSPYLLVPVVVGAVPADRVDRRVRASLVGTSVAVLGSVEGTTRLEAGHSSEPSALGEDVLARWASRSREALRHLARGEYDAAREALLEAQAISARAAEALNRESSRARQVLDTCLFDVRAALETGEPSVAQAKAFDCRRLVPRMQPSAYMHTPEVRALVERVDTALARESAGALRVRSEPAGCTVRVNGVPFGATPLDTDELPRGRYRVQVECEARREGRVHVVELDERDHALTVDVAGERALRSRPFVALHYDDAETAARRASLDARALARATSNPVLLAFVAADRETVSLQHVPPRGAPGASLPLAAFLAVAPFVEVEPVAAGSGDDAPARSRDVVTGTFAALGGATLGAALGVAVARAPLRAAWRETSRMQAGYLDRRRRMLRLGLSLPVLAGVGAPLASVATVRSVERARHPRRVAGALGASGVVLAGAATVVAVRAPRCYGAPPCLARDPSTDAATWLAAAATPLMAAPFGLLRRGHDTPQLALRLTPESVALVLSGSTSTHPAPHGPR